MQETNTTPTTSERLELWGGHECTVNRIGDGWHDQTLLSGHQDRLEDLSLFASLGIRSLRYPALWERISPQDPAIRDFSWTDERLAAIRVLGMNPILTLCHHGSGPHYTSLLHDNFATGLAAHALAVAQRYPWVRDWTPVNEPLTTARFSALYGYWYPHTTDERLFWLALLNEIDATRLAMRAIRQVNPNARLVQTDDLGYCHATEPLACEAAFQNERRWAGWDLLCGMVVPGHALWDRIAGFGLEERLRAIADDPSPPDIIGINHYLSSERLLDHRIELHPHRSLADRELGNCAGVDYVDVDAIRNRPAGVVGLPALLRQAWERYRLPVAVTECHNGATRDEQARWFVQVWNDCSRLREEGMDLRAVTAWSLLGSYDWNRMVTTFQGHYEPGVFDVRAGVPQRTVMVTVLRDLAAGRQPELPVLATGGWWQRASRLAAEGAPAAATFELEAGDQLLVDTRPLLIVGDDSVLTTLAVRACELRGLPYVRVHGSLRAAIAAVRPWSVLDARDREGLAGPRLRHHDDPHGPRTSVARVCAEEGVRCGLFTSAFGPGLAAEGLSLPGVLVARTGPVYAPWVGAATAVRWLDALDAGEPVHPPAEGEWHDTYGPDLVDGVLDLLLDGASGAFDFALAHAPAPADVAQMLAVTAGCDAELVRVPALPARPTRPHRGGVCWLPLPQTSLERFVRESRLARSDGELGVRRRQDEDRLEEAG